MTPPRKKEKTKTNQSFSVVDREPPKSIEAERSVLGAVLLNPDALNNALEIFGYNTDDIFYHKPHQTIFDAICDIYQNSQDKPDIQAVASYLESKKQLADVGGFSYLSELLNCVSTSGNINYYATTVMEMALLRRLIDQCSNIVGKAYESQTSVKELIDQAESDIFTIATQRKTNPIYGIKDLIFPIVSNLETRINNNEDITGLSTGFNILDSYLCGLQPSEMIVLAARPSIGKTAFALNIANQVALMNKTGVLIFSLEMSKEQLIQRLICMVGKVDGQMMRKTYLAKSVLSNIVKASGQLEKAPIYIDDTPNINIMEIRSKSRRHLLQHPDVKLIIIDYLQLMSVPYRGENRQVEIAEISRQIKGLARELGVPILALCQLSREAEKESAEPRLAHLRESGAIEQDADVVLMLYKDKKEEKESEIGKHKPKDPVTIYLKIAKQRNGPTGIIKLAFHRSHQLFLQISEVDESGEPMSKSYVDQEESPF